MQEIKISFPQKYKDFPNLIETDNEEVQFLIEILQDLAPWEDRHSVPENLPVKITSENFSITLEEIYNKPKSDTICVRCGNAIIKDTPYTYWGIEPLCQDCYEQLPDDN